MIGIGIGLGRRGTDGAAPVPALFQAANADGWTATYASPPAFDPIGAPETFTVTRQGFDAAGNATTPADTLTVMSRLRQPFPNQTSLTADQVTLSDFVHAGDTVAGAANNSTRAAPRPVCLWLQPDLVRATGSVTVRLAVAQLHARNGRPVAAVKFILSDGTATVEQIVSTMSTWVSVESGRSVPHHAHTFPLAGFAANVPLTLDAIVYPHVGAAFQASVHGAVAPSISFGNTRVFNDVSYGTAHVYVDAVSGNNGTGVASTNPATAAASPFLNISNACTALRTFNNANFSRDHVSGGVIRLVAGTHIFQTLGTTQTGTMADLPVLIEAAGGYATRATTILRDNGASNTTSPVRAILRNLTLRRTFTTNLNMLHNSAAAASPNFTVFDACAFDLSGGTGTNSAWIGAPGRVWMLDCTSNGTGFTTASSTNNKVINLIGGTVGPGSGVYNMAGVKFIGDDGYTSAVHGTGNREAAKGNIIGWCHLGRSNTATPAFQTSPGTLAIGAEGFALVGNVVEDLDGTTATNLHLWADGNVIPVQNIVVQMNTGVGERTNALYQDTGTATVAKSGSFKFNVFTKFNIKTDVFGANGNLIGNWPAAFKCGARCNAFLQGDNNNSAFGTGNWMGEVRGLGEVAGTTAAPVAAAFANPQAPGAGNGDYTPGPGSALPFIPAGLAPYPHDQLGRAVPDDGSARVGALMAL